MTRTLTLSNSPRRSDGSTPVTRCAIYTRKSTEEGLEQEFNTLDAQRESGENFVRAQLHEGWETLPERYDDGGFTGGNMDRPALKRLMTDIEAGKVDCVVVYKVDRLSRSLLDFARMMETFQKHRVAFVSVTQQFNTSSSMGRLILNVLLSFAQFEREMISERTRDKIAASRRKGKWSGGMPLLGYNVDHDPRGSKLIINEDEADQVRTIFELYLEHQSLLAVVGELERRGWGNKRWPTRKGTERGGKPFTKTSLHKLLTNVTYLGKLRYKQETHEGEHQAIVDPIVWKKVQTQLKKNAITFGRRRSKYGGCLGSLLRCVACDAAMTHMVSCKNGGKRYRYYVCVNAQKRGWHNCPSPSIPAGEIEKFVVEQIKGIGRDPELIWETLEQCDQQSKRQLQALEAELAGLDRELARWNAEVRDVVAQVGPRDDNSPGVAWLAELQERLRTGERRAYEIREEIRKLSSHALRHEDVVATLGEFDGLWEALTSQEQSHVMRLLVETVEYDGPRSKVAVTLQPQGVMAFAEQFACKGEAE